MMTWSTAMSSMANKDFLPIVKCPRCSIDLVAAVCGNEKNGGHVYYKCPNYSGKNGICSFFKWEEDYRAFVLGILTAGTLSRAEQTTGLAGEAMKGNGAAAVNWVEAQKMNQAVLSLVDHMTFLRNDLRKCVAAVEKHFFMVGPALVVLIVLLASRISR